MKKKTIYTPFILALICCVGLLAIGFGACNSKDTVAPSAPSAYDSSWWLINNKNFYTHHTFVGGGHTYRTLSGASENGQDGGSFVITFNFPYIPLKDTAFKIYCGQSSSLTVCMELTINNQHYRPNANSDAEIFGGTQYGKAKIKLPATSFFNTSNAHDSIIVSGVFRQP